MSINSDFNPIQYISDLTHVAWKQEEQESSSLRVDLVEQKAYEILGILQKRGIEANLTEGRKGLVEVRIPYTAIDNLIELKNTLGTVAPWDISPLIKAVQTQSLGNRDQIAAVLREIRDNEKMSVPELMKRSDLDSFESILKKVYDNSALPNRARRFLNIALFPGSSLEGICSTVLQSIATAKLERQENAKRIFEELESASPDRNQI
ncbi:MAG: hypothetical protein LLG04_02235 [Parachlamydia sp.]|nr:hypothetical protein [Parachlamydia sp.]